MPTFQLTDRTTRRKARKTSDRPSRYFGEGHDDYGQYGKPERDNGNRRTLPLYDTTEDYVHGDQPQAPVLW